MDRSVDSIGSCSLDVDADSTDFSDTSGELNFLTPNSGKDITKEFTAGIKERCKIPVINCQAVTTVLDLDTGHINTVLTTTSPQQQQPVETSTVHSKKPSYLNLACCVNGYSNLTTYDSKLRQDINKSREVSPSRPIIATLHYNRTEGSGGLLTAPTLSYVSMNNNINNGYRAASGGNATANGGGGQLGAMLKTKGNVNGRVSGANGTTANGGMPAPVDVTDNAAAMFNGNGFGGLRMKVISSQSQIGSVREQGAELTPKKSFIQQRVEKLYGNAEGVVINKQLYSSSERKYLNNIVNEGNVAVKGGASPYHGMATNGNGNLSSGTMMINGGGGGGGGGGSGAGSVFGASGFANVATHVDENNKQISEDPDMEALPVMRHLRPEFRAQLQICSPKKVPKGGLPCGGRSVTNGNHALLSNGNSHYAHESGNQHHHSQQQQQHPQQNGSSCTTRAAANTNGTATLHSQQTMTMTTTTTSTTTEAREYKQQQQHHTSSRTDSSNSSSVKTSDGMLSVVVEERHSGSSSSLSSTSTVLAAVETIRSATKFSSSMTTTESTNGTVAAEPVGDDTAAGRLSAKLSSTEVASVPPAVIDVEEGAKNDSYSNGGVQNCDNHPVAVGAGTMIDLETTTMRTQSTGAVGVQHNGDGAGGPSPKGDDENKENMMNGSCNAAAASSPVLDGNYFLQILKNEQNRLRTMAGGIETEIEMLKADGVEISDEIAGHILVAAGKARLLCSEKMKQFEGLCHKNLNQSPDEKFQTTDDDLRGFWDMLMLQVNNIDASFAELDTFRQNGWKKPVVKSPTPQSRNATRTTKLIKRPYKTPATANGGGSTTVTDGAPVVSAAEAKKAAASAAAAKREAQRKQLLELKRKQKLANGQQQNVEIFAATNVVVPSNSNVQEVNLLDASPTMTTTTPTATTAPSLVETS